MQCNASTLLTNEHYARVRGHMYVYTHVVLLVLCFVPLFLRKSCCYYII